ncbi:hypothetical protein LN042_23975 [Kitasatospora sp. RB6PN24]|uniref:hypothetical protein n=1 Tax=Kitasatospora humi TaxID=2893891 RepID=UPI001E40F43E|nr:hypothetical protein [Kitasatospora humi]MCC9310088.1 hypothetical protein [Kitasatospora humi]
MSELTMKQAGELMHEMYEVSDRRMLQTRAQLRGEEVPVADRLQAARDLLAVTEKLAGTGMADAFDDADQLRADMAETAAKARAEIAELEREAAGARVDAERSESSGPRA